jgi:hypothetical protein
VSAGGFLARSRHHIRVYFMLLVRRSRRIVPLVVVSGRNRWSSVDLGGIISDNFLSTAHFLAVDFSPLSFHLKGN